MRTLSPPRVPFLHTFRAQVLLALALIGILPWDWSGSLSPIATAVPWRITQPESSRGWHVVWLANSTSIWTSC